ncbi:nucleoside 2-deoxyribosyltransferase [Enterococcus cecorum]|uniref:nucleoside 2-deoxyribosyltransferase n=1 Tax=Enterococcus cecorum TaxID=44008 RepID=UPI001FABB9EC|nr:nucleoside 2-deoxyribosyltransferase [Enterococcus cecorum]MCJ0538738.1 nucleoside 2-deoxyribosyltransferase [Enterococcus cecorum]MCJ0551854.1 nucleoside 2-deoxyribosyltransferase [Enterococcus cecorum]MCJ0570524.1 nucleoside 2-deoxyribosyltransferase [Enterococcus cecorum]
MKINLGTPITGILSEVDGTVNEKIKIFIEKLLQNLRREGHEVFCALELEEFGNKIAIATHCTPRDFERMKESDLYIVFPNNSYGCAVELGWASAFGKPILILQNSKFGTKTPLYEGMKEITNTQMLTYDSVLDFPDEEKHRMIFTAIQSYISKLLLEEK